ncbi:tRNA lysidine(34) synthetase TilS [Bergeriella denitrificans]|uniref:tRNA(Ile)-lysidine synthase n=1 Tax=Bergeriella denitrificans TaxID=494 RepID=A0A378UGH5_BERDE|nr:tRNA lysidine(34) synthetase TilS [Bergeriella denitrificans]STZ76250.1 tRNA(Ile)-lysidine synthetase (tRNA(Ile)-lysidine synthase; tRNA(Ile)-2-lysyl-cytidine synthase) [Bergeriella denitrificans]
MDLFGQLMRDFPALPASEHIEAGLSGGLDSVVLLHLLARARQVRGFKLGAVHVHHGLNTQADAWADFCRDYCAALDVPLRICRVQVEKNGLGIEAAARQARYRAFSDGSADIIALAHHQDDQVETFMLSAVRGGGLRGLAAMPEWRALNPHLRIWRPLLAFGRSDLAAYAAQHGLQHIEDGSNEDTAFLRNWLRREALPRWQEKIPHLNRQILSNIRMLQQDLALLDEIVAADYQAVCAAGFFSLDTWRALGEARRRHVLLHFLRQHGVSAPQAALRDFSRVLMQSDSGEWRLPDAEVYAYRKRLWLLPRDWHNALPWQPQPLKGRLKDILLQAGFALQPHPHGLPQAWLAQEGIIRAPEPQARIAMPYGHKAVSKILQERHILPAARKVWPLITDTSGSRCLAIAGVCAAADVIDGSTDAWLPVYQPFRRFYDKYSHLKIE